MGNDTPPNDKNLESAIISSVFVDPGVLPLVSALICEEDFYQPRHQEWWRAILAVSAQALPIDMDTVLAQLKASGRLDKSGGVDAYTEIRMATANSQHAEGYAIFVRKLAGTRRIMQAAQRVLSSGYASDIDHDAYANDSRSNIGSACDSAIVELEAPQTLDEDLRRLYSDLERGEDPQGLISTGIPAVDDSIGGLWPGLVHLIAARPSMGKSCMGLNIATNAALAGKRVLMFSLEDMRYFIAVRMMARFGDIDSQALTRRKITAELWKNVNAGYQRSTKLPLWVDQSGSLSVAQIRAKVLRHRDKEGLDLLVIDHLAEIDEPGDSDTQSTSRAMRGIRDLTKELGVPTLLLHQLNRKVEDRVSKVPILSDLKQSGKVEEAARFIGFLCRPGYYEGDGLRHDLQFHVAKANHGCTGMVKLWCDLSRMYIRGWDPETDGEFPTQLAPQKAQKQQTETARSHYVPYEERQY